MLAASGVVGATAAQDVIGQLAELVGGKMKAATPGALFSECTKGPVMVAIPPGRFVTGFAARELEYRASEDAALILVNTLKG